METRTRPGWYYVGEGQLEFHDEDGWTGDTLLAEDIRGHDWPPPAPSAAQPVVAPVAETRAPKASRLSLTRLLRRSAPRPEGRHSR